MKDADAFWIESNWKIWRGMFCLCLDLNESEDKQQLFNLEKVKKKTLQKGLHACMWCKHAGMWVGGIRSSLRRIATDITIKLLYKLSYILSLLSLLTYHKITQSVGHIQIKNENVKVNRQVKLPQVEISKLRRSQPLRLLKINMF